MVLSKVGGCFCPAIAVISASCSAKARSKAGIKCSGLMRANGGAPKGVAQDSKNGLSVVIVQPMRSRDATMSSSEPQKANGPHGKPGGHVTRSASPLPAHDLPVHPR